MKNVLVALFLASFIQADAQIIIGSGGSQVPQIINYQGRVVVGTTNFTGTGQFKFALVSQGTEGPPVVVWRNDGSFGPGDPTDAVALTVTNGLYSVLLGDTALTNMTAIPRSAFNSDNVSLRVWFDDGVNGSQLLTPDQRIAAVGYAMMAGNVSDGAITAQKIAPGSVGMSQLEDGAVNASKLAAGAVGAAAIANGAVLSSALAADLNVSGNFFVDGELVLPATTDLHHGVVSIGGNPFLHYSPGLSGVLNTFVGAGAGNFTMSGRNNTATGYNALVFNTDGESNTASGYSALGANTTGSNNIALGMNAGANLTTGSNNIDIGHPGAAAEANTIRLGTQGVQSATVVAGIRGASLTGGHAVYVDASGKLGTQNNVINSNTVIGEAALALNGGSYNTAIGAGALIVNANGLFNTATGENALYHNISGSNNTASGSGALGSNTSGSDNIAFGRNAGSNLTTGSNNIAIGHVGVEGDSGIIRIGTAQTDTFLTGIIHGDGSGLTGVVAAAPPGMVLIPAGTFTMGDSLDGIYDATPTVSATISAFYMDVNEVSLSQWQSVYYWAVSNGYTFDNAGESKGANHPVQDVNWHDCVKWCNARSEQAGKTPMYYTDDAQTTIYKTGNVSVTNTKVKWTANGYRLPTEAEWEKAARGGRTGQRFPWGNVITQNLANYEGDTASFAYDLGPNGFNAIGSVGGTSPATSPVGSFAPNGYGLNDMAGNVFEWCWDWYNSYGYPYAGGTDPHGVFEPEFNHRVIRGGTWDFDAGNLRCASRATNTPEGATLNFNDHVIGFRTVLAPGQP